jgi:hypothetical protein
VVKRSKGCDRADANPSHQKRNRGWTLLTTWGTFRLTGHFLASKTCRRARDCDMGQIASSRPLDDEKRLHVQRIVFNDS